ncbi:MAG: chromosome segregation protein SMC, partial [Acidobacteria bacterium]
MRLQRLEISGFKSFPDRSELAFDDGVTAIVGPNGCGKSNVVDAITWVLGEQSAKSLRGDQMLDVIFSGSDARKPTAAAEVRLRLSGVAARVPGNGTAARAREAVVASAMGELSTAAFSVMDEEPLIVRDVDVSRRLYRSGESEYLIDGEVCRLRDVQDLLMDAGVGVKAYAVIEQGKIGQILSARPTDRRQLIEEAAGVTKYKTRRRAAELKLEAAQQNLTRIDDIIFEVEKQRGALKRQAAKARRYKRLRDELRRWEKVQIARRYRVLAQTIEAARARLADARARETAAEAHLAEVEASLERVRLELAEADGRTTAAREAAHARELAIGRLQQQMAFDRQQGASLRSSAADLELELAALGARREPARTELDGRREAADRAADERDQAAARLADEESAYARAHLHIEGLEGDVEAARSEVFAAVNAATALRHAMAHASAARTRIAEQIGKLDVEAADLRVEAERAAEERAAAEDSLRRAREVMEDLRVRRAERESALGVARTSRDGLARELRDREHERAGMLARLKSLEEMEAARVEYGDGARMILAESTLPHLGSVVDYLEVDRSYERAVEACLGDLLQHVVVKTHGEAAAGLSFARERNAGRVGFVIVSVPRPSSLVPSPSSGVPGPSSLVADAILAAIGEAWIAESADAAREAAGQTAAPVATLDGEVFRGAHRLEGGARAEARGLLTTKREIKELRERATAEEAALVQMWDEIQALDVTIAAAESAIVSLQSEQHRQEKAAVGFELQTANALEAAERVRRKQDQIDLERRGAQEELRAQEARHDEARESIARIEADQRVADEQLSTAQRRLFEAREAVEAQARRTSEAKAAHAALVERAGALATEVRRLEEAAADLEHRFAARSDDLQRNVARRAELEQAVAAAERQLDEDVRTFDSLRDHVRAADEASQALRAEHDAQDARIREARRALEAVRADASRLEVDRATSESDLTHLATSCVDAVQSSLDEVSAEVEQLERDGVLASPRAVEDAPEPAEIEDEGEHAAAVAVTDTAAGGRALTPDEMVADLRMKIERMGAVNMMAIDQFDDLDSRHTFLTAQRKDLVDSIAATNEAIRKIDKTTRERFQEAFTVINQNFEGTFTTLFGGGKAGLVLLDESDTLESGIDIIAQPPGKRLQSVQLLSGG